MKYLRSVHIEDNEEKNSYITQIFVTSPKNKIHRTRISITDK